MWGVLNAIGAIWDNRLVHGRVIQGRLSVSHLWGLGEARVRERRWDLQHVCGRGVVEGVLELVLEEERVAKRPARGAEAGTPPPSPSGREENSMRVIHHREGRGE